MGDNCFGNGTRGETPLGGALALLSGGGGSLGEWRGGYTWLGHFVLVGIGKRWNVCFQFMRSSLSDFSSCIYSIVCVLTSDSGIV